MIASVPSRGPSAEIVNDSRNESAAFVLLAAHRQWASDVSASLETMSQQVSRISEIQDVDDNRAARFRDCGSDECNARQLKLNFSMEEFATQAMFCDSS